MHLVRRCLIPRKLLQCTLLPVILIYIWNVVFIVVHFKCYNTTKSYQPCYNRGCRRRCSSLLRISEAQYAWESFPNSSESQKQQIYSVQEHNSFHHKTALSMRKSEGVEQRKIDGNLNVMMIGDSRVRSLFQLAVSRSGMQFDHSSDCVNGEIAEARLQDDITANRDEKTMNAASQGQVLEVEYAAIPGSPELACWSDSRWCSRSCRSSYLNLHFKWRPLCDHHLKRTLQNTLNGPRVHLIVLQLGLWHAEQQRRRGQGVVSAVLHLRSGLQGLMQSLATVASESHVVWRLDSTASSARAPPRFSQQSDDGSFTASLHRFTMISNAIIMDLVMNVPGLEVWTSLLPITSRFRQNQCSRTQLSSLFREECVDTIHSGPLMEGQHLDLLITWFNCQSSVNYPRNCKFTDTDKQRHMLPPMKPPFPKYTVVTG